MPSSLPPILPFILLAAFAAPAGGQAVPSADTARATAPVAKRASAVRVADSGIELDGRLHETVWRDAPLVSDFVQKQPREGAEPDERTEVRFAYDGDALYVGARMFSRNPAAIQAPVSRRDNGTQAEYLLVSLDTYLDRRTAYTFGVTASGVRLDWYHPSDDEDDRETSFHPVWEARTSVDSLGWTAEMRIPFSQLRFNDLREQRWGLNLNRWIPARNEDVFWVPVPRDVQAWSSRFGALVGIEGARPTRRLELMPYVASDATLTGSRDPANPFDDGRNLSARAGGDVKMGLGPNLTLEATVNPDFGQVEADPAEVNLSAFETFFDEKRPFFIEGSELLGGNGPSYFYSRRIGSRPRGQVPDEFDFVDYPKTSTILGAAKLTGRLASGTSLGALAAVTDREYAEGYVASTGVLERLRVQPRAGYAVVRAQQEFGAARSTAGVTMTGMARDLPDDDPLRSLLNRRSIAGGGDWSLRLRGGEYEIDGFVGFSYVEGDTSRIRALQESPVHYFQRPDQDHVTLDPLRTSLGGYAAEIEVERNSGRHWLWEVSVNAESPGFDLNDAGRLGDADGIFGFGSLTYRETKPGRLFQDYSISLNSENLWNFGGIRLFSALRTDVTTTFRNFWVGNFTAWMDLRSLSHNLTRGGPLMGTGRAWVVIGSLENAVGASTRWNGRIYYG
ncbi:MAG: DUF5916 domain-containing protein, partial [Gemmatimonadaceae bacterium]